MRNLTPYAIPAPQTDRPLRNVLFVCTGNICRSPMAEAVFADMMPELQVFSAGLQAVVGAAPDPVAIELMAERGLDISEHRGRQLAHWMAQEADLVLLMDAQQLAQLQRLWPRKRSQMRLVHPDGVPDPYRCGRRAFRHALALIEEGVEQVAVELEAASMLQGGWSLPSPFNAVLPP